MTTPTLNLRLCDVCGVLDDHPRHVTGVPPDYPGAVPTNEFLQGLPDGCPALAIAELMDSSTIVRHMNCCATMGCATCTGVLAATNNAAGDDLRAAIVNGDVDHLGTGG